MFKISAEVIHRSRQAFAQTNYRPPAQLAANFAVITVKVADVDPFAVIGKRLERKVATTIDLDHEKPDASQWGRFRSRAFKFTYTSDNPLRIRTVEISYNEGVH